MYHAFWYFCVVQIWYFWAVQIMAAYVIIISKMPRNVLYQFGIFRGTNMSIFVVQICQYPWFKYGTFARYQTCIFVRYQNAILRRYRLCPNRCTKHLQWCVQKIRSLHYIMRPDHLSMTACIGFKGVNEISEFFFGQEVATLLAGARLAKKIMESLEK